MAVVWVKPLCDKLLVGFALQQGRDIVMHQKKGSKIGIPTF